MKKQSKLKSTLLLASTIYTFYKIYKISARPKKKTNLKDQVVIITGASRGIGKSYADVFAKEGCKLVLAARDTEKLQELEKELQEKYNSEILIIKTDVTKQEDAYNLINETIEHFGHIDILINNAGISTFEYFHKDNIENLKNVMDVNYWGMIYCTHAVLPSMLKRRKGKIVNISSFAGKKGIPVMANYSATKHAMQGFSEGLRVEVAKYGIDVHLICPTSTKTGIVLNSPNSSAVILDKENYFGMTPERVAKETLNAILDNKKEHIIGRGENLLHFLNTISPSVVDFGTEKLLKYVTKE